jgi:hypothetical protein
VHALVAEVRVAKKATRKKGRKPATRKTARKSERKTTRKSSRRTAPSGTARKKTSARAAAVRRRRERTPPPKPSRLSTAATVLRGVVAGAVAAVTSKVGAGASTPDALEILEREHRRFEELLKQGDDTTERARATRRELLAMLTGDLNVHELMEEKVLYPALQAHPQAREVVLEGFQEHHFADVILKELHEVATNDEAWGAKFAVLKENVQHHIDEEERIMFRLARGIFSPDELRLLAARMQKVRSASR